MGWYQLVWHLKG